MRESLGTSASAFSICFTGASKVRGSLAEVHGEIVEGPTKTGKVRTVVVPKFLASILSEHLREYGTVDGYVFT